MISGDSTASHMGSVKNIEKARERRTYETMPGSSEAGVPDDLLQHAETVHPRMGYDMSDSIFMQEQQAADRTKQEKKAMEERAALEAFRAATLRAPAKPIGTSASASAPKAEGSGLGGGEGKRKQDSAHPMPIAGIKLRKRSSSSGGGGGEKNFATGRDGASERCGDSRPPEGLLRQSASTARVGAGEGLPEDGKKKRLSSKKSKRPRTEGTNRGEKADTAEDGGNSATDRARTGSSKKTDEDRDVKRTAAPEGDTALGGAITAALGLVAYSSGDDDDPDGRE